MATPDRPYPVVDLTGGTPRAPRFPDIEQTVLAYWDVDGTFAASIENRSTAPEFVFYDGPPFANGLPHYGHLLTGYVKDVIPRFQTMRGKRVERRFGWDTHGLPAELEAERQLGITDKAQIETMGVDKFNEYCRDSVLRYTGEWRTYVQRQARWVDFDNDYKTLDLDFMESVMWAFKELYDKGLIYQGYRVLPYSWYEQTPLSNQESKLDDAYRMRQDPALTVTMPLHAGAGADGPHAELNGVNALIWTTTPWTLPSNLAIAVHPDTEYSHVRTAQGTDYLLATALVGSYTRELGRYRPSAPISEASWPGWPTPRRSTISGATRTPTACSLPTTSRPTRAPAWFIWRRHSAKRTWTSPRPTGSRWYSRWIRAAASPNWCPTTRGR